MQFCREIAREFPRYRVYAEYLPRAAEKLDYRASRRLDRRPPVSQTAPRRYYFHHYQRNKYLSADKRGSEFTREKKKQNGIIASWK